VNKAETNTFSLQIQGKEQEDQNPLDILFGIYTYNGLKIGKRIKDKFPKSILNQILTLRKTILKGNPLP